MTASMKACLLAGALLLALLCGCGGGGEELRQFGSLQFNLTTPKTTYTRGEQVPLTFTVKNVGAQTVTTVSPDSGTYKMKVMQENQVVWFIPQGVQGAVTTLSFAPGEIKTFSGTWNQRDLQGNVMPPGQYTAKSSLSPIMVDGVNMLRDEGEKNLSANPIQITL